MFGPIRQKSEDTGKSWMTETACTKFDFANNRQAYTEV